MLSAALRSASTGSLATAGASPTLGAWRASSSGDLANPAQQQDLDDALLGEELMFGEDDRVRSALSAPTPTGALAAPGSSQRPHPQQQQQQQQHQKHHAHHHPQQQQPGGEGPGQEGPREQQGAWNVPAARPGPAAATAAAAAAAVDADAACLARSMPRPISGTRLQRLAGEGAPGGGGDGGGGFVPPHLAASLAGDDAVAFGESMSTAKGAAGLRLRHQMLARTGYLDGHMPGAASFAPAADGA